MNNINETMDKKVESLLEASNGQQWIKEGFTLVANKAITNRDLTSTTFKIYVVLLMHLFRKDKCFPSLTTIANEAGLNHRQNVSPHIKKLIKLGYILVESGKNKGSNNIYRPIVK